MRDASKLSSWLRGIVRNLVREQRRQDSCNLTESAALVDLAGDPADQDSDPIDASLREERSRLLWSILEGMPENYREPMILFYRKGESVTEVARLLDLSTDAVKQRLARGRQMVKAEVAEFVEEFLEDSGPGQGFAAGVMAALPTAAGNTTGKAAVGLLGKLFSMNWAIWIGPLIGFAGGIYGTLNSLRSAKSKTERRVVSVFAVATWSLVAALLATQFIVSHNWPQLYAETWFQATLWGSLVICLVSIVRLERAWLARISHQHKEIEE